MKQQFLEDIRKLVRSNSVTPNGTEEVANFVQSLLQRRGLKTQLQQVLHSIESFSQRQFHVIGILGDPLVDKKTRKGLLLANHLDTASPGLPENWTESGGDPFSAVIRDGKVYGLGVADAKLDLLCKLRAIEKFREKKLRQPVYIVGTCGEEHGMFGAKYLIKSLALNPKYVVVGGPTDLRVVHGHKSMASFKVSIGYQLVERDARGFNRRIDLYSYGTSAHGACPDEGLNAILLATDFLKGATENGFEVRFTKIEGGDTVNRVPDRALTEFYLTSHQFEDFKRYFRETVRSGGMEKHFRVELGGLGDMGVRFLPDPLFPCLIEVIGMFRKIAADLKSEQDDRFHPAHSTVSLGQVAQRLGGVDLFFDVRTVSGASLDQLDSRINEGVQALASRYPSLNLVSVRERTNPGLDLPPDNELVAICGEALEAAGIDPHLDLISSSTEAAQFAAAGYSAVVFGPGSLIGNSHSPNEHLVLEQLDKATAFYEKLIEKVCL